MCYTDFAGQEDPHESVNRTNYAEALLGSADSPAALVVRLRRFFVNICLIFLVFLLSYIKEVKPVVGLAKAMRISNFAPSGKLFPP